MSSVVKRTDFVKSVQEIFKIFDEFCAISYFKASRKSNYDPEQDTYVDIVTEIYFAPSIKVSYENSLKKEQDVGKIEMYCLIPNSYLDYLNPNIILYRTNLKNLKRNPQVALNETQYLNIKAKKGSLIYIANVTDLKDGLYTFLQNKNTGETNLNILKEEIVTNFIVNNVEIFLESKESTLCKLTLSGTGYASNS